MLYKPTSASPHMDTVNPDDKNGISFSCDMLSSNKINKIQLMINDGTYEHYFQYDNPINSVAYDNYGVHINCKYTDATPQSYSINTKNNIRSSSNTKHPLSMSAGRNFTWCMRLYENNEIQPYIPTSSIGWGTIDTVSKTDLYANSDYTYYSTNNNNNNTYTTAVKVLKIRPHTNMYFRYATYGDFNTDNLWSRYDSNAKYYIKTGGSIYEIHDYRFYNPSLSEKLNKANDLDKYNDPIWGYAIVDSSVNISEGDEYTILCNYIDTDTYYFETSTPPTISLYEYFDNNGNPVQRIIDGDNLTLNYSNLNIHGEYIQNEGASINYYSFLLEEADDYINEYTVINSTNNINSPFIKYSYNRFLNNKLYRLTLSLTDTAGVTTEKVINIQVQYKANSFPLDVKLEECYEHGSLIIDFSNLKSISGKESNPDKHEFIAYDEETGEIDKFLKYTKNACHLDKGNSIIYDYIDGDGDLVFGDSTYYLVCNIDSDYMGTIFEITDEGNTIARLSWDGIQFMVEILGTHVVKYFSPYDAWLEKYFQIGKTEQDRIDAINSAMQNGAINYTIPFLYHENMPYNESDYYHEETAVSGQTWAVIIDYAKGEALFKNISDNNSLWQKGENYYDSEWRQSL